MAETNVRDAGNASVNSKDVVGQGPLLATVIVYVKLLPTITGFGAPEALETLTSAIPWTVETTVETLLSGLGSRVGVSIELTVAVLVMLPGDVVPSTMVSVMVALLVMLPILRTTRPALVLMLPAVAETKMIGVLLGNWTILVTPVKGDRPLLLI